VAQALYDMELPRTAGGALPETVPGAVLALADRFDLLAGLFAVGAQPTGSSDPFALRRAALGVVSILRARPELAAVSVSRGLEAAAARIREQGVEVPESTTEEAHEFVVRRLEQLLLDSGQDHTLVQAVLPLADVPSRADATLRELAARRDDERFRALVTALQRVRRIVPADVAGTYDPSVLTEPAELALHGAVDKARSALEAASRRRDLAEFADLAAELVDPIDEFFDAVLVMAEDPTVRAARLGLLATIRDLAAGVVDWDVL
ncbi:MAG TPA: glycine--tRNA ligase subunit beta, partial [Actinopolymorphaceae bacterium]